MDKKTMTKQKQFYEYQNNGGSMSIDEWEKDGRFYPSFKWAKHILDIRDCLDDLQERIDNPEAKLYLKESLIDIKTRIEQSLSELQSQWD